jgi:hypothetical protein
MEFGTVVVSIVAALWALSPVLLVRSKRSWLVAIGWFLIVTWPIGVWDIAVERAGMATIFAMLMGPFLGPVTLVSWILRGGIAAIVGCMGAILVGGLVIASARKATHLRFIGAYCLALVGGYVAATVTLSVGQYVRAPSGHGAGTCIVRQPLWSMIKTARTHGKPRQAHAIYLTASKRLRWSIGSFAWVVEDTVPNDRIANLGVIKECKPIVFQTY